jgi:hypothetical protein
MTKPYKQYADENKGFTFCVCERDSNINAVTIVYGIDTSALAAA